MRKPRVIHVSEAEAAVLLYSEGLDLSQAEFDDQLEEMRKGVQEVHGDAQEAEAESGQG